MWQNGINYATADVDALKGFFWCLVCQMCQIFGIWHICCGCSQFFCFFNFYVRFFKTLLFQNTSILQCTFNKKLKTSPKSLNSVWSQCKRWVLRQPMRRYHVIILKNPQFQEKKSHNNFGGNDIPKHQNQMSSTSSQNRTFMPHPNLMLEPGICLQIFLASLFTSLL